MPFFFTGCPVAVLLSIFDNFSLRILTIREQIRHEDSRRRRLRFAATAPSFLLLGLPLFLLLCSCALSTTFFNKIRERILPPDASTSIFPPSSSLSSSEWSSSAFTEFGLIRPLRPASFVLSWFTKQIWARTQTTFWSWCAFTVDLLEAICRFGGHLWDVLASIRQRRDSFDGSTRASRCSRKYE